MHLCMYVYIYVNTLGYRSSSDPTHWVKRAEVRGTWGRSDGGLMAVFSFVLRGDQIQVSSKSLNNKKTSRASPSPGLGSFWIRGESRALRNVRMTLQMSVLPHQLSGGFCRNP